MRKPRTVISLLTAVFVAVGFSSHPWSVGKPAQRNISGSATTPADATPAQRAPAGEAEFAEASTHTGKVAGRVVSGAISSAKTPRELSADDTKLVAEMCELQLLANGTDLALNSRQWSAFATVVLRTQAIQQTYEARIATSKMIEPGRYRVEIPMYANAGDLLRENFNVELRAELGQATAADVLAKIGSRLEGRFAGFGVSAQTLDIIADSGGKIGDVQVMRTVTYWNSVESGDRPITRREMHFPVWEDQTGDSWSALLAMVKA